MHQTPNPSRLNTYFTNSTKNLLPQLFILLSTAIEMLDADKGVIQFYDRRRNTLRLMAQIGFKDESLRHLSSMIPGDTPWAASFRAKDRVIVDNVDTDVNFSHLSAVFKNHGYCALQSTPLLDNRKQVFAILTTHFSSPRFCDENALAVFDAYLRQAVPIILRRSQAIKAILEESDDHHSGQRTFPFLHNM